jgi:ribonuclease HI
MQSPQTITIYTDGGARGNPGPAGIGAIAYIDTGSVLFELREYLGTQTNNYAEYEAVIRALETAKKRLGQQQIKRTRVQVYLDSQLVAKQLSNEYQVKEASLFPQFMRVHNLMVKEVPDVSFTHIPRSENKEADRLANEAMDEQ